MKKILFDCERMRYPNTGIFHFCNSLGHALLKQANPIEEQLTLYLPVEQKKQFESYKNIINYNSLHKFHHFGTAKYNVWHCTFQASHYLPNSRKPNVLITIHDLNFLYEHSNKPDFVNQLIKRMQKNVDRAQTIVAISDYVAKDIKTHFHIKDQTIQTIYNGWNVSEFPGYDNPIYRPVKPFLFAIGTVIPKKNFHTLPCLLKKNDYELIIAGEIDIAYKEKILDQAVLHGVTDKVKIIGPVSEQDKYWYYVNCLAFMFPSLAEGFGAPAVEAMYYGKPVFLSNLTSLPEIGGDVAYYFCNFEAESMQEKFEKGMQHYSSTNAKEAIIARTMLLFKWENAASKYLEAYRKLY